MSLFTSFAIHVAAVLFHKPILIPQAVSFVIVASL